VVKGIVKEVIAVRIRGLFKYKFISFRDNFYRLLLVWLLFHQGKLRNRRLYIFVLCLILFL